MATIKAHHTRTTGTGRLAQPSTHHHRSKQLLAGWRVCEDGDNHETMIMTRPNYRMTRAPGTAIAGDSEGDENKTTMTTTTTTAITTTPPTAAASNCSWGGNGGKDAEEGEDADDGPRTTDAKHDDDEDVDDKDKARGRRGHVSPSPTFCMGRVFSFLFVFN